MHLLETLLLLDLFFLVISILRRARLRAALATLAVILSTATIVVAGFRIVMAPTYGLALGLLALSLRKPVPTHKAARPVIRGLGTAGLCICFLLSSAVPMLLPVVHLPEPSGPHKVGTIRMDFTDPSRPDLLTATSSPQKIAVQIWYPASDIRGKERARWLDNRHAARLFARQQGLPAELFQQFGLVRTNSYLDAEVADSASKYPVVLFSGGAGMFNGQNTIQMEELASHGYAAFAVSHPSDDFAVIYSDDSVLPYSSERFAMLVEDSARAIEVAKKRGCGYQQTRVPADAHPQLCL